MSFEANSEKFFNEHEAVSFLLILSDLNNFETSLLFATALALALLWPSRYNHTYIHTYIHTCIHTCTHTYIHTHMHAYILAHIHTYMRRPTLTYTMQAEILIAEISQH